MESDEPRSQKFSPSFIEGGLTIEARLLYAILYKVTKQ